MAAATIPESRVASSPVTRRFENQCNLSAGERLVQWKEQGKHAAAMAVPGGKHVPPVMEAIFI